MVEAYDYSTIQLILLKNASNDYLIAEIEERDESPECLLTNARLIDKEIFCDHSYTPSSEHIPPKQSILISTSKQDKMGIDGVPYTSTTYEYITLQPFPFYTKQNQIYLRADDILTLADPSYDLLEYYKKTVG